MYATDRQTGGRTDKRNAYCPLPYGRGHNKIGCLAALRPSVLQDSDDTLQCMVQKNNVKPIICMMRRNR